MVYTAKITFSEDYYPYPMISNVGNEHEALVYAVSLINDYQNWDEISEYPDEELINYLNNGDEIDMVEVTIHNDEWGHQWDKPVDKVLYHRS